MSWEEVSAGSALIHMLSCVLAVISCYLKHVKADCIPQPLSEHLIVKSYIAFEAR